MLSKKRSLFYLTAGILFTALAGTALHFLFDWSGRRLSAALIAPVNESVWEHLKLLFFPMLFYSVWEYLIRKPGPAFLSSRTCGILSGLAAIVFFFYTYTGIFGTDVFWADILIFLAADILAFLISFFSEKRKNSCPDPADGCRSASLLCVSLLLLLTLLFFLLTFFPPAIPLFQDPQTGGYGIG